MNITDLTEGEEYSAVVDRFSGRNAIISTESGHINLGPIDDKAEGKEVKFEYIGSQWGRCLDEEYTYQGYRPRHGVSRSLYSSSSDQDQKSKDTLPEQKGFKKATTGNINEKDPDNKNKLLNGTN